MAPLGLNLAEIGTIVVGAVVVVGLALFVVRTVKRAVSGCMAMGLGCLTLILGLIAVGAFVVTRLGIRTPEEFVRLLGG